MEQEFASQVLNAKTDIHFATRTGFENNVFPHKHDFYEFFLLVEGRQEYESGGKTHMLMPGALVLVRPGEAHARRYIEPGRHINVAFLARVAGGLFAYLGPGFPKKALLHAANFPFAQLGEVEARALVRRLEELGAMGPEQAPEVRTRLRVLVFELFVNHFANFIPAGERQPDWFDDLLREMQKKRNFLAGVPRMTKLSGKSSEHLCRSFQKRKGCTPTQYVNRLRVRYAAGLLAHSDKEILDIALDSGFESLSHFYRVFGEEMGTTPKRYRHAHAYTVEDAL